MAPMSILRYASVTEIAQLIIAIIGLSLAMWGIWTSIEDAVGLTDTPPEDWRRLIAKGNMRGQLARMSAQGVLVYVGIVSVLLPPPWGAGPDSIPEIQQSILARIGLILVTTILTVDMFFERKQRMDFMRKTRSEAEATERRDYATHRATARIEKAAVETVARAQEAAVRTEEAVTRAHEAVVQTAEAGKKILEP